jgi:hypothetical protein
MTSRPFRFGIPPSAGRPDDPAGFTRHHHPATME